MSAQDFYTQYPRQESSGKALASLILGICGLVVFPLIPSILAIVFALHARAEIDESGGRLGGASQAQAGLILGCIGIAIDILGILLIVLLFAAVSGGGGDVSYSFG